MQASEEAHAVADGGLLPTSSVVDVINNLYCTQAAAPSSQLHQQMQRWCQLDAEGRPLIQSGQKPAEHMSAQQGTAVVGAAEQQMSKQTSCGSSVGSWDPEAADKQAVGVQSSAAAPGFSKSQAAVAEAQHQKSDLRREDTLSAESTCAALTADQPPAESQHSTPAEADRQEPGQQQHDSQSAPPQADAMQPAGNSEGEAADAVRQSTTVYLTEVGELLAQRAELQAELSGYVQQVTSQVDEAGQPLVDLPANYSLMVSCSGWLGVYGQHL